MNNISYPLPSEDNQSFVLLNIALSAVKRTIPEANSIGNLPEKDEERMVKLGLGILNGKTSSETYSSALIKIIEKIIKKKINSKDKIYLDNKIQRYVKRDLLEKQKVVVFKEMLEKLTGKKVILEDDRMTTSKYIKPLKLDERLRKLISIDEENKIIYFKNKTIKDELLNYIKQNFKDYKLVSDYLNVNSTIINDNTLMSWIEITPNTFDKLSFKRLLEMYKLFYPNYTVLFKSIEEACKIDEESKTISYSGPVFLNDRIAGFYPDYKIIFNNTLEYKSVIDKFYNEIKQNQDYKITEKPFFNNISNQPVEYLFRFEGKFPIPEEELPNEGHKGEKPEYSVGFYEEEGYIICFENNGGIYELEPDSKLSNYIYKRN